MKLSEALRIVLDVFERYTEVNDAVAELVEAHDMVENFITTQEAHEYEYEKVFGKEEDRDLSDLRPMTSDDVATALAALSEEDRARVLEMLKNSPK